MDDTRTETGGVGSAGGAEVLGFPRPARLAPGTRAARPLGPVERAKNALNDGLSDESVYDLLERLDREVDQRVHSRFDLALTEVYEGLQNTLVKKHHDYGPLNIARSPGGALNGLRVRIWDKLARINNLLDTGATPENEPLRDSFADLANYAVIALLVLDGDWPDA